MNDETIPYRSAIPDVMAADQGQTTEDEVNYDTLKAVRDVLQKGVDDLYKDFNAFTLLKEGSIEAASIDLLRQIAGKQEAYDILAPVLEAVVAAMRLVDEKYKQR